MAKRNTAKRSDGLLERKVTINGKRRSVYGHSAEELDIKAAKLRQDAEQGIQADKAMTLDKMYTIWKRNRDVKESTLAEYDKRYQSISKHIGSMKLTDITPQTCDSLKEALKKESVVRKGKKRGTLSSTGINNRLSMLNGILHLATIRRLIPYNPMDSITPEKRTETQMKDSKHRALSREELTLFFKEAEHSDYYPIMRFLAYTGMRSGEAAALTWGDISNDSASVTKTTTRIKGVVQVNRTPKTKASIRNVPLSEDAQKVLTDQKKRLMKRLGGCALQDDALVFPKSRGGLVDSTVLNTCILQIVRRINKDGIKIELFAPHCFRHTFASLCVDSGVKPEKLQKILGHSKISTTMDTYYHTNDEAVQEEIQKVKFGF